jgi:hypothetical protein
LERGLDTFFEKQPVGQITCFRSKQNRGRAQRRMLRRTVGEARETSLRAKRSNPFFLCAMKWIASRSLSSGAHSRDPLARNDVDQPPRLNAMAPVVHPGRLLKREMAAARSRPTPRCGSAATSATARSFGWTCGVNMTSAWSSGRRVPRLSGASGWRMRHEPAVVPPLVPPACRSVCHRSF